MRAFVELCILFFAPTLFFQNMAWAQMQTDFSSGGAVRVGDSTTTCDGGSEGAIRFDADGGSSLDYCDGSNWLSLLTSSVAGGVVNNGNSFAASMTIGTNDSNTLSFETNNTTRMTIDTSGNVGIGTSTPRGTADVNGTLVTKAATDNTSGTTIDFATGNFQYTDDNCQAYTLHNLKDGGTYNFAIKGTTQQTCSFTAYNDAGSTSLTVHLPAGHGSTTSGEHTIYTIMVMGSDAYFSWVTAFD